MPHELEHCSFSRAQAAALCGITDAQLKLWIDRNGLFPEKRQGRGHHMAFNLSDLFKIKAVAELVRAGVSVGEACDAIQPYSVYGTFVHDSGGEFFLSRNHEGRWVGAKGYNIAVTLNIYTYELFRQMLPGLRIASGDGVVDDYLAQLEDMRRERGW